MQASLVYCKKDDQRDDTREESSGTASVSAQIKSTFSFNSQTTLLTTGFPLVAILLGVVQVLALHSKHQRHREALSFLARGIISKSKKANLTLVPEFGRVRFGAAFFVGLVHFLKEALVPLAVNVPVLLHRVRDIGRLDQVLNNHNGRLAVTHTILARLFHALRSVLRSCLSLMSVAVTEFTMS